MPSVPAGTDTEQQAASGREGLFYLPYLHARAEGACRGGFARASWVAAAAGLVDAQAAESDPGGHLAALYGHGHGEGLVRRYRVEVGPGKVRVGSTVTGSETDGVASPRGEVVEWSRKSRTRMVETMASLDWTPVVEPDLPGWRPAMVTLTLPGGWEELAPTGAAFKALMRRWFERWARRCWCSEEGVHGSRQDCPTRHKLRCVWKLEFQRRGAPHLHLYMAVPAARWFREWLSRSWADAVGAGGDEYERHLAAGTGVDWSEGIRASDPKRLAVYFLKRATGHNVGLDKEYQHRVPELWRQAEGGPGRFWGYRGLEKATVQLELDVDQYVQLRRLLRRWAAAQGRPVRALSGGHGMGGMVLANDAPSLLSQACRWRVLWRRGTRGNVAEAHPERGSPAAEPNGRASRVFSDAKP